MIDSDSTADFSWPYMQTGSRNPPKPEVVITGPREDISTWSQRLWHSTRARLTHIHLRRHWLTTENTIRYTPEVEKVSRTASTNNVATETDTDAISMAVTMFWRQVFHLFICQPYPMLPSPWNSKLWMDTRSSYNLAIKNDINVILQLWQCFRAHPIYFYRHRHRTTLENTIMYKKLSYCWETVRRDSMPNIAEMDVEMTT